MTVYLNIAFVFAVTVLTALIWHRPRQSWGDIGCMVGAISIASLVWPVWLYIGGRWLWRNLT